MQWLRTWSHPHGPIPLITKGLGFRVIVFGFRVRVFGFGVFGIGV